MAYNIYRCLQSATASISLLHLLLISIDSRKIRYFTSSSLFSLSPAAGRKTVAGGVISCMMSQSAVAGSGESRIVAKRPSIAAPSTTDAACERGSTTGMLHTFASRPMSAVFWACDPERYSARMECPASLSLSTMCRV